MRTTLYSLQTTIKKNASVFELHLMTNSLNHSMFFLLLFERQLRNS